MDFNLLSYNKNFKKGNAVLKIDLNKISKNYLFLSKLCKPGIAGAVVKADAYGCGMSEVGRTLLKSGCNFFKAIAIPEIKPPPPIGTKK